METPPEIKLSFTDLRDALVRLGYGRKIATLAVREHFGVDSRDDVWQELGWAEHELYLEATALLDGIAPKNT